MNWLDWLIVLLLGWSAFVGLRRGLVGMLVRAAGALGGLVLGVWYARPAAAWLDARLDLVARVTGFFQARLPLATPALTAAPDAGRLDQVVAAIRALGLPAGLADGLVGLARPLLGAARAAGASTVAEMVAYVLAVAFATCLGFFFVYLLVRLAAGLLGRVLAGLLEASGIGAAADRLGGLALGLLEGALGLVVALVLLSVLMAWPALGWLRVAVEGSRLAQGFLGLFTLLSPWLLAPEGLVPR